VIPTHRQPTLPGEVLLTEFLEPLGITQTQLAERLSMPIQRINGIVRGRRAVTAETAMLLARVFGTSPEFWLNLQTAVDMWKARRHLGPELASVKPFRHASSAGR
jgi:addiction module HigA family antidote